MGIGLSSYPLVDKLVQIRGLSVRYASRDGGEVCAVDGVSLEVGDREILGILGESGSGKSTLATAVLGLLPHHARIEQGSILFRGRDLLTMPEGELREIRGREIAMVPQDPALALNPVMTVGAQIGEVLRAHLALTRSERRARVCELLGEVGLEPPGTIYGAYPHQLSGGQRQRVVIAQAIACRPALVIADEPTSKLDSELRKEIGELLLRMRSAHATAWVVISHDAALIAGVADRVAVMHDGRMVKTGGCAEIFWGSTGGAAPRSTVLGGGGGLLRVEGLSKTYVRGGRWRKGAIVRAASEVEFEIRAGETLGLVGASGSGKSTVARCVVGMENPDAGRICFEGSEIAGLSPAELRPLRAKMQMIFQDAATAMNPRFTAAEAIQEPLRIQGRSRDEQMEMAEALMKEVALSPEWLNRPVMQFSGGQQQRLAIARALTLRPKLLVLDEALSGLDASIQAQMVELLRDLQESHGLAYLLISHDLAVVAQMADTLAVMAHGRIVESGSTAQVMSEPKHEETKRLLSAARAAEARLAMAAGGSA